MPLLTTVMSSQEGSSLIQVAFTDDLTGIGKLKDLKTWWDSILKFGPYLGYDVNENKSWLIDEEPYAQTAKTLFQDSAIKLTSERHRHLGAIVGTVENKGTYVGEKVQLWVSQVKNLSQIATTQPHAAFTAFIHGLRHRFTFLMCTVPDI